MWPYGYNMMGWGGLAGAALAVVLVALVVAADLNYRPASRRTSQTPAAPLGG